ncbi:unnamed protein product [Macrosiphum euphorbiae]|uniref:RING-type domain-containing protein n=1 Tax=Macrosiphum euphorbiae TaxID=13131 RepID=A0AAV0Y364_9HEMI|nr:unnamed protein product [Macrosiphum euphorbiae]
MALPLLPVDKKMFENSLPVESCRIFQRYFQYYKSTWLQGPNADILSVNSVIWRTNNVLEVSHQHLRMHISNMHHPEPWVFLIEPIISESCYICHYSMPTVIAIPCRHQGLCAPCHQTYIRMPPYRTIPYYRCPLCRGEITTYFIIV